MTWLKVGEWVLNIDDISAAQYTETRDGPTIGIYTRSGRQAHEDRGGFRAEGEEAQRLWAWFVAQSTDVMTAPTPRKARSTRAAARVAVNGN